MGRVFKHRLVPIYIGNIASDFEVAHTILPTNNAQYSIRSYIANINNMDGR